MAAPSLLACSAQVTDADLRGEQGSTQVTALVEVDRRVSDARDPGHSEAIARFVRAFDPGALDLVSSEIPAMGTCATSSSATTTTSATLLDVGAVSLEGAGVRTAMVPRRLPDVVDLVSGVVYTARGPEEGSFGAGRYVLHVAGNAEVPSFAREAEAPSVPAVSSVAEQSVASTTVVIDGASEVVWEPDHDLVIIEVSGGPKIARCAFADTGRGQVPAWTFGSQGTLTVHRVHREPFTAPGIEHGEIRFDFARVVPYRHR